MLGSAMLPALLVAAGSPIGNIDGRTIFLPVESI